MSAAGANIQYSLFNHLDVFFLREDSDTKFVGFFAFFGSHVFSSDDKAGLAADAGRDFAPVLLNGGFYLVAREVGEDAADDDGESFELPSDLDFFRFHAESCGSEPTDDVAVFGEGEVVVDGEGGGLADVFHGCQFFDAGGHEGVDAAEVAGELFGADFADVAYA